MILGPSFLNVGRLNAFRLNYEPADLVQKRRSHLRILIGGSAVARIRVSGLTVHDVLNSQADTAAFFIESPAPLTGQSVRMWVDSDHPYLLFAGKVQTDDRTYEGRPNQLVYPVNAIDDTSRLNMRRPIGTWSDSATTVARELVARFAPGFTTNHVQAGLPTVTITFDGAEDFVSGLNRMAGMIGGYCNVEDRDVWLFLTDPTIEPPDPIMAGYPFLDDPPIKATLDDSQLMTRVYGRGHGAALLVSVNAGETILPLEDTSLFPASGLAIAAVLSDGASSERLAYTSVQAGVGGTLVGPGVSPGTPPTLRIVAGGTLLPGVYQYAYTDVTPSGESLTSPRGTITITGTTPPLASAPVLSTIGFGAGVDPGTHEYVATGVTATGQTTPSLTSAVVTVSAAAAAPAAPTIANDTGGSAATAWVPGDALYAAVAYTDTSGHTTTAVGAINGVTASLLGSGLAHSLAVPVVRSADPRVTQIRVYVRRNGVWIGWMSGANTTTTYIVGSTPNAGDPTVLTNTLRTEQVQLSVPFGDETVTARSIYRRVAGVGTFKLAGTIPDNATGVFVDTITNAGLGVAAPSVNTATAAQVAPSGIALGPGATTSRKLYRTIVNGAQLNLQQTIANNTVTTGATDNTADGSLGATAPGSDTSGFTQPAGQVVAGATSVITAGAGAFAPTGGWARPPSGQVFRYTGISGNTLTGVPSSGVGSIQTTMPYNTALIPAPALVGVSGLTQALAKGSPVHIWVQRDDLSAQAQAAARETTPDYTSDGIHEFTVVDDRRGATSLIALCDAHLQKFSRPIVTVAYATRDKKTKAGKTVHIDLAEPLIAADLVIQEVTITEIDVAPSGLAPRYTVTASSVRFSLEDLLRRLLADAEG